VDDTPCRPRRAGAGWQSGRRRGRGQAIPDQGS
jgi:hypothetical protein